MGDTDNTHDMAVPDIPIYVYIISGLLIGTLLGTQLLGMWLTGFKKPVPVRGEYDPISGKLLGRQ
ncbi:hypothetical protein C8A00DRAFT_34818 [Chaetomidium leptoderma]|uniref:Uncharacterized protein n=1 Tax=Chaetomidium leptoderma TaxID=669021 RepID=A0AAN6VJ21_9PEZI|nr:hypothetical protein C8A00DRAFT_34818 [Chaetomidium leptoderma]